MSTTEQNMGIKADKAHESPSASAPKVAPTAGGVTAPGVLTCAHTPEMTGEAAVRAVFIGKRADNVEAHIDRAELEQIATAAAHYDRMHNGHAELLDALTSCASIMEHPRLATAEDKAAAIARARAILAKVQP